MNVSQLSNNSGGADAQWRCDLARGLLRSPIAGLVVPRAQATEGSFVELGLPAVDAIPIPSEAGGHPLGKFINKPDPLGLEDLREILTHPSLDLSLIGFHSGAVTAAVQQHLVTNDRGGLEDYSRNMWARDGIIAATALNRAGYSENAHQIVKSLWAFAGSERHRGKILQFHWGGVEHTRRLFLEGNNGPHIKYSVNEAGGIEFCNHDWGHQQLDALGAMVWAPFRFANSRGRGMGATGGFDLRKLDPMPWASDSILPATIKMLHGVEAHNTCDYGPWEDIREWRRATSVGIVLAALNEARIFHDREGWEFLPVEYGGKQNGQKYREQLETVLYNCISTVQERIPEHGFAVECDRRPCDSAMILLLYPFDCNLKVERQNTILRTVYRNMGAHGFRRWDVDLETGPDLYVGQEYFLNRDPRDKGEFAKNRDGFRPAEWTLFDPLLAAYFYRRFIQSNGGDHESLLYADRHLKRSLSFITTTTHALFVEGKGRMYEIPAGILPEAFAWDSVRGEWRPNHNSPLLMAQAALGLAFERAHEAHLLAQSISFKARREE